MDGGGEGWCVQRCAGGAQDKSLMNRVMLRFRPIAPKPASGGTVPPPSDNKNSVRTKRKYVRVRRNSGCRRKKELAGQDRDDGLEKKVVTLQLLPERVDLVEAKEEPPWCSVDDCTVRTGLVQQQQQQRNHEDPPMWLNLENTVMMSNNTTETEGCSWTWTDRTVEKGQGVVESSEEVIRVVESLVTVECVTDTCMDVLVPPRGVGVGDVKKDLEVDTCPALISDGLNRVEWVNGAYRRMVRQGNDRLIVELVVKERLPLTSEQHRGFSCRVRVQLQYYYYYYMNYHTKNTIMMKQKIKKGQWSQMVVPCDVWKMDGGGYAWRLDTEAALCLGR